jgi:hypothetical protein
VYGSRIAVCTFPCLGCRNPVITENNGKNNDKSCVIIGKLKGQIIVQCVIIGKIIGKIIAYNSVMMWLNVFQQDHKNTLKHIMTVI